MFKREDRIRNGIKKVFASRKKGTQVRLDSFFKVTSTTPKRKAEEAPKGSGKKIKKELMPVKKEKKAYKGKPK